MNTSTYSPNSTSVPTVTPSFSAGAAKPSVATSPKEDTVDAVKKGLFDILEPIRRHPVAAILGGTGAVLVLGGAVTAGILENQRRQTFSYRFMKGLHKATHALSF